VVEFPSFLLIFAWACGACDTDDAFLRKIGLLYNKTHVLHMYLPARQELV